MVVSALRNRYGAGRVPEAVPGLRHSFPLGAAVLSRGSRAVVDSDQVEQGFASSVVGAAPGGTPRNVATKTTSPSPTLDALCT